MKRGKDIDDPNWIPFFSRLSVQVVLGLFVISTLSTIGINLFLTSFINTALRKQVGEGTILVIQQAADKIENIIDRRTEYIQAISNDHELSKALFVSNESFDLLENRDAYIAERDKEWIATPNGSTTPFMRDIIENDVSKELHELGSSFEKKYGYPVYAEMFITNKYGVNVGQTGRTSDYYQADEAWWQTASQDGLFVSDITYDESSGVNAIDIAVALTDDDGNVTGVIKTSLNIQQVFDVLEELAPKNEVQIGKEHIVHGHNTHNTMNFTLLQRNEEEGDEKVVYSTEDAHTNESLAEILKSDTLQQDFLHVDGYIYGLNEKGVEVLRAYAHTDTRTVDWMLMLESDTSEIFGPAKVAIRTFIVSVVLIFALVFFLSILFMVRFVITPIKKLSQVATEVAKGNLSMEAEIKGKGEIGYFSKVFNEMTKKVKESQKNLEKKVTERTRELLKAQKNLEEKLTELEKFQEITMGRELKMIELKEEIKKLKQSFKNKDS